MQWFDSLAFSELTCFFSASIVVPLVNFRVCEAEPLWHLTDFYRGPVWACFVFGFECRELGVVEPSTKLGLLCLFHVFTNFFSQLGLINFLEVELLKFLGGENLWFSYLFCPRCKNFDDCFLCNGFFSLPISCCTESHFESGIQLVPCSARFVQLWDFLAEPYLVWKPLLVSC